ncbi:MAG: pilus assembly protein PilM [Eubacterium sp.]|nr:pilus assembly protein PilM [Eubacterium sp.]
MAKKVIVVRVGAKTIRIVHMDNNQTNPTVYGCVRVPTPQGAVVDGEVKNIIDVSRRIKQACMEKGITTKDVIFSLVSSKIANRETTIPFVKDNKIQGLVMAKVDDMFPIDKDRYIFSYVKQGEGRSAEEGEHVSEEVEKKEDEAQVEDDTKKKGKGKKTSLEKKEKTKAAAKVIDLLVYAAPIDLVRSYYALAEGCDFNIVSIEVDGNGIFQIMKRQMVEGVEMAVQINRDNTLIDIMSKDKLLLQRVIPYGATTIIETAMDEPAFQVSNYDKAFDLLASQRVLLHSFNAANPQNDLSMQKRIELTQSASSLIGNISRVMEYYNSRYRDEPIQSIIVTGNGARLAGIHELMNNELGIPARTPTDLVGVTFNRQIEVNNNILQYIGCFGAVFNPVNFVPDDIKNKTATKDSILSIAIVFAASFLLCAVLAIFSIVRVMGAEDAFNVAHTKAVSMQPIEDRYNDLFGTLKKVCTFQDIRFTVDTNNNRLHSVLEYIKEACPDSFRIDSVSTSETGGTINCTTSDRFSSVSAVLMRMNLCTDIRNVTISSGISKSEDAVTKKRKYVYTITYEYVPHTDTLDESDIQYREMAKTANSNTNNSTNTNNTANTGGEQK